MANRRSKSGSCDIFYFLEAPKTLQMGTVAMKLKDAPWKESYDTPRQCIKKSRDITLPTMVLIVKALGFSIVMYECESWTIKKAER